MPMSALITDFDTEYPGRAGAITRSITFRDNFSQVHNDDRFYAPVRWLARFRKSVVKRQFELWRLRLKPDRFGGCSWRHRGWIAPGRLAGACNSDWLRLGYHHAPKPVAVDSPALEPSGPPNHHLP